MARPNLLSWLLWIAVGAGLGLYVGWVVVPVEYVDTAPSSLQAVYKDDYILMLATVYAVEGDLAAARAGLTVLEVGDPAAAVRATTERLRAANYPATELEHLDRLAKALAGNTGGQP
jgi:hypothetical protein